MGWGGGEEGRGAQMVGSGSDLVTLLPRNQSGKYGPDKSVGNMINLVSIGGF